MMETLERDLSLYKLYTATLATADREDTLAQRLAASEEVLTSSHLLVFIRKLTQSNIRSLLSFLVAD